MKRYTKKHKLKEFLPRFNKLLSVLVFILAIYIIATPFLPELELLLKSNRDETEGYVYRTKAAEDAGVDDDKLIPIPEENRIVIPNISVDAEILEGSDISILNHGQSWRRPNTSNPKNGGNTVIVGHRYFGQGKNTFYHLNKLETGADVIVFWEGKEHNYKVQEVFETNPENIEIEENTKTDLLTLYTCSGLSADKRFVIKAYPVET